MQVVVVYRDTHYFVVFKPQQYTKNTAAHERNRDRYRDTILNYLKIKQTLIVLSKILKVCVYIKVNEQSVITHL